MNQQYVREYEFDSSQPECPILPTAEEMQARLADYYSDLKRHGWRSRMRWRFGYFAPEAWYGAVVDRLVGKETAWIDVGGGKAVFPDNKSLSRTLADRCSLLVGVDPSDNIQRNPFVHQRAQCTIEEYVTPHTFDLATLRMVAEHIPQPDRAVESLARLIRPGGKVVIYTPNRWSLASIVASMTPQRLHSRVAGFLWRVKDEDVFPTVYQMNTRRQLQAVFAEAGFREAAFAYLDDCSLLQRFRRLYPLELASWTIFRMLHMKFPENNLLGVYEKNDA